MEGFGIVILEAKRAGVPVISADLEGMRDVVQQGVNGYRVPHSNSKVFAEKIDYVLMNGLQELSADAREYALKNFSWDTVRSEEHTSELQSRGHLVCRLLLEKKKKDTMFKTKCDKQCK